MESELKIEFDKFMVKLEGDLSLDKMLELSFLAGAEASEKVYRDLVDKITGDKNDQT